MLWLVSILVFVALIFLYANVHDKIKSNKMHDALDEIKAEAKRSVEIKSRQERKKAEAELRRPGHVPPHERVQ